MTNTIPPWPAGCHAPAQCCASGFCEYDRCPHGAELTLPKGACAVADETTALTAADDDWETCVLCDDEFLGDDQNSYVCLSGKPICPCCTAVLIASGDMETRQ